MPGQISNDVSFVEAYAAANLVERKTSRTLKSPDADNGYPQLSYGALQKLMNKRAQIIAEQREAEERARRARHEAALQERRRIEEQEERERRARLAAEAEQRRLQLEQERRAQEERTREQARLRAEAERLRVYLVECDRGTMPVDRRDLMQTSLKRKFLTYAAAHREGMAQSRWGWKVFRVLLVCPTAERSDNALSTIRASLPEQLYGLFLIADRSTLSKADILSHPWRDAHGRTTMLV